MTFDYFIPARYNTKHIIKKMKKVLSKKLDGKLCSRCGNRLIGWENESTAGRIEATLGSVINETFAKGAGMKGAYYKERADKNEYFELHPAVEPGKHYQQSLVLSFGYNKDYALCWQCNTEFIKILGAFFTIKDLNVKKSLKEKKKWN